MEGGGEVREGRGGGEGELIGYSIEQKKTLQKNKFVGSRSVVCGLKGRAD